MTFAFSRCKNHSDARQMAIFDFSKAKNGQGVAVASPALSPATNNEALNLLLRLQQSLDVRELIEEFVGLLIRQVHLDGYQYQHLPGAIACQNGHQNRHEIAYGLQLEGEELGAFRLFRSRPYSESECEEVENLLALLLYPLRNALRYQQALRSAYTDPLTGLCNRSTMLQQLQRQVSLSRREGSPMSLLIVDIDNFKNINDRYGHLNGDKVIRCVATHLRESLRDFDLIFRYGGEEFVVVLGATDLPCAGDIAERLRQAVASHTCVLGANEQVSPTISLGVAQLREAEDPMELFNRADSAMYEAKSRGRNAVAVG